MIPDVFHETNSVGGWYRLEARDPEEDHVSGEVHLEIAFQKTDKKHYGPEDFKILKLIGKGPSIKFYAETLCLTRNDRYLRSSLSSAKKGYPAYICYEGSLQKGHRSEERSRPHSG